MLLLLFFYLGNTQPPEGDRVGECAAASAYQNYKRLIKGDVPSEVVIWDRKRPKSTNVVSSDATLQAAAGTAIASPEVGSGQMRIKTHVMSLSASLRGFKIIPSAEMQFASVTSVFVTWGTATLDRVSFNERTFFLADACGCPFGRKNFRIFAAAQWTAEKR